MRARQFRPTVGFLESRISLSDASGTSVAGGASGSSGGYVVLPNDYQYIDTDGPNSGDYDPSDPGYTTISDSSGSSSDGFNGVLIDSVVN